MPLLIRKEFLGFVVQSFGPSINHRILRHAIIGVFGDCLDIHLVSASKALKEKLENCAGFDRGDLHSAVLITFAYTLERHIPLHPILSYIWPVFKDIIKGQAIPTEFLWVSDTKFITVNPIGLPPERLFNFYDLYRLVNHEYIGRWMNIWTRFWNSLRLNTFDLEEYCWLKIRK